MPILLDDSFYLNILWFIDGQFTPMRHVINNQVRSIVSARYTPLYQMLWKMAHTALRRIDPKNVTEKQTTWAKTCLEKVDSLDELWLPPSEVGADPSEDFGQWAEKFKPALAFFDDELIEDFMRFIPGIEEQENPEYKRVRRILWLRKKRENPEEEGGSVVHVNEPPDDDERNDQSAAQADEAEHADAGLEDDPVQPQIWGDMEATANQIASTVDGVARSDLPGELGGPGDGGELLRVGDQGMLIEVDRPSRRSSKIGLAGDPGVAAAGPSLPLNIIV